eukprot:TRINITY_DN1945_c0_g1_i2.p1 TRINITY_DN1945_c0_g1~~TRINITY_DN1945_c0_g1_i2.p1  ORF type:complete len:920 (-),score=234.96 TRINITY_DN1945_c0_g1_i2:5-2764(-)
MLKLSIFLVLILQAITSCVAVQSCGGFVKASSSLMKSQSGAKVDYSIVKMHLYTMDGLLKYSTECAPHGYFFIPVYDKGTFSLQIEGPQGWNFEPKQITVTISDTENGCAEDINFAFTGFTLSGIVAGATSSSGRCPVSSIDVKAPIVGPSEVQLSLYDASDRAVASTSSDQGYFGFSNILPGIYTIRASHPTWTISPKEKKATMVWGNLDMKEVFRVQGYELSGRVSAKGDDGVLGGVAGVDIFLYSAVSGSSDSLSCSKPLANATLPDRKSPVLCATQTDRLGNFFISNLVCGQYVIVPHYKHTFTTFDVEPKEKVVDVLHGNVVLGEDFQVTGFSVRGRVVDTHGKGIENVAIFVNTFQKAFTDRDGYYRLEQMTTARYLIKAVKPHLFFYSLKNYHLSPNVSSLPDITVERYHLCGVINSGELTRSRAVYLVGEHFNLTANTDAEGNYCFEAVPGNYRVVPTLTDSEMAKGVLLSPPFRSVALVDNPILNLNFMAARVRVSGHVRCLASVACDSATVVMSSTQSPAMRQLIATVDSEGSYVFTEVLPGPYTVTVQQDNWCFERGSLTIVAEYDDVKDVDFVQNGFAFTIVVSHDNVAVNVKGPEYQSSLSLKKGSNTFCLPKSGKYQLVPRSCYRFDADVYSVDTNALSAAHMLEWSVLEYQVQGSLLLPLWSVQSSALETTHVPVRVHCQASSSKEKQLVVNASYVRDEQASNDGNTNTHNKMRLFEYRFWAGSEQRCELIPEPLTVSRRTGTGVPSGVLFYPRQQSITIPMLHCPPPVPAFVGREGMYMHGTVKPHVRGVKILVQPTATPSSPFAVQVVTDERGHYHAGPLHDDLSYTVSAVAEGYYLREIAGEKGNFTALKLGQVNVMVKDQTSAPLADVLLSLSGGDDTYTYRSNNVISTCRCLVIAQRWR